jgi:hypothetical protein
LSNLFVRGFLVRTQGINLAVVFLLGVLPGLLVIVYRKSLARLLCSSNDDSEPSFEVPKTWLAIGFALIGVNLLANGIIRGLMVMQMAMGQLPKYNAMHHIYSPIVSIVIGFALIILRKRIARALG